MFLLCDSEFAHPLTTDAGVLRAIPQEVSSIQKPGTVIAVKYSVPSGRVCGGSLLMTISVDTIS